MTDTLELNVAEAIALIDSSLNMTMSRELLSAGEVTDLLLDVRTILAASPTPDVIPDDVLPAPIA